MRPYIALKRKVAIVSWLPEGTEKALKFSLKRGAPSLDSTESRLPGVNRTTRHCKIKKLGMTRELMAHFPSFARPMVRPVGRTSFGKTAGFSEQPTTAQLWSISKGNNNYS